MGASPVKLQILLTQLLRLGRHLRGVLHGLLQPLQLLLDVLQHHETCIGPGAHNRTAAMQREKVEAVS